MKNRLYIIILTIGFLVSFMSFSKADRDLDSLFNELDKLVTDSSRIELYNDLSWDYCFSEPHKAIEYAFKAYNLSSKNNLPNEKADALTNMANAFYFLSRYDTALHMYEKSLKIKLEINDLESAGSILNNIGMIQDIKGNYKASLDSYKKALKMKEETNDNPGYIKVLNNIGVLYQMNNKYEFALDAYHKCLTLKEYATPSALSDIYSNIGLIYYEYADTADTFLKSEYFSLSLNYHKKALRIRKENELYYGMSLSYTNIGNLFAHIQEYQKAIEFYKKSINIQEDIQDINGLALNYHNLGSMYNNQQQYSRALKMLYKSLERCKEIENLDYIVDNYKILSKVYENVGALNKALKYSRKYSQLKDSITNVEALKQMQNFEAKFKTKEKELELVKKQEELKSSQLGKTRIIVISLVILVIVIIFFTTILQRSYKTIKKANRLLHSHNDAIKSKNDQIGKHKKEIEEKNKVLTQTHKLLSLRNKEITDSLRYAQNIQEAILPADEKILRFLPKSFIMYIPKDYVSGDFYWVDHNWERTYFAVADCTGHGVPGAFMSIVGHNLLNSAVNEHYIHKPADILEYISKEFKKSIKRNNDNCVFKAGMEIGVCNFDPKNMILEFAGAFHSLIHIRDKEVKKIKGDLIPIGKDSETEGDFTSHQINLQTGDMIYLFTDGFSDQFGGGDKRKFMRKRLINLFNEISHLQPSQQKQKLEEAYYNWKGDNQQVDDILVFGIKI